MTIPPPRLDPNILDLRQVVADRQAEAKQQSRGWSLNKSRSIRQPAGAALHRPSIVPRDWGMFRKELLKFGFVLVIVGVVSAGVIQVTQLVNAKTLVTGDTAIGIEALQDGLAALGQAQPTQAVASFSEAQKALSQAEMNLSKKIPSFFDQTPFIGDQLVASRILLGQAIELAVVGQRLAKILPAHMTPQPAVTIQSNGIIQGSIGVLESLLVERQEFISIVSDTNKIIDRLDGIDPDHVPGKIREHFITWHRLLKGLTGSGETLDHLTKVLLMLFAPEKPREYLVFFQNNNELRPTGGFPGTYLLIKFEQGTFKILDAPGNGPFALSVNTVKNVLPPQPLLAVSPHWSFHDANWFLDVPTSAKSMLDFYTKDRGFTPDGVIFLTPGVMEDLLRITGPVRPENYKVDINAENFVSATEQQVEFGYDKALNNPKQFLIDLVPLMLTKLSQVSGPDALRAIAMTLKRANQNDLLLFSRQSDMQQSIAALGWAGALLSATGDYLAVVDTNLGGGKTDRLLDERVKVAVTLDGSLLRHEITVTRTNNNNAKNLLSSYANQSFIRVYTPAEAQFIGVTGATVPPSDFFKTPELGAKASPNLIRDEGQTLFDQENQIRITNESGRKVFGAWSRVDAGQSQTLIFTYTTVAPTNGIWQLDWQHQPGAPLRTWEIVFTVHKDLKITTAEPLGTVNRNKTSVTFNSDSLINRSFSVRFK